VIIKYRSCHSAGNLWDMAGRVDVFAIECPSGTSMKSGEHEIGMTPTLTSEARISLLFGTGH